jgi:hypothetical protein
MPEGKSFALIQTIFPQGDLHVRVPVRQLERAEYVERISCCRAGKQ